jgi:hypothetical protein
MYPQSLNNLKSEPNTDNLLNELDLEVRGLVPLEDILNHFNPLLIQIENDR